jgi:hypothetical protein
MQECPANVSTQPNNRFISDATIKASSSRPSSVELLETRIAPSTLALLSPTSAKYTDTDGDTVTVKFTKSILTQGNFQQVLVITTDAPGDHLTQINLTAAPAAKAQGTGIAVRVVAGPLGDGATTVGYINADGLDLGAVSIAGDLASIMAGDGNGQTVAVASLSVQSMGRFGLMTGVPTLQSEFIGGLGKLSVATDVIGAALGTDPEFGKIGSVTIGGSLKADANGNGGTVISDGNIGAVKIGGSVTGGIQTNNGSIRSVFVGGSLDASLTHAGYIRAHGLGIGAVTVVGSLEGGSILSEAGIASVTIGGSITGGADDFSGTVRAHQKIGPVRVGGSVTGGGSPGTGYITSDTMIAKVTVGGSLVGGTVGGTGNITAGVLGPVVIGGDVVGTTGGDTGEIWAFKGNLASVTVKGSCFSGASFSFNGCVLCDGQLGPVSIGGNVVGKDGNPFLIRAKNGITSLTVTGSMDHGLVLAGYSTNNTPVKGGASIGAVKVGVDWVASSIVAGAKNSGFPASASPFGDANDTKIGGSAIVSRIARITIGGYLRGTPSVNGDHFGFIAQQVGSFKVGGAVIPLTPAAHSDNRTFTVAQDVTIHEV